MSVSVSEEAPSVVPVRGRCPSRADSIMLLMTVEFRERRVEVEGGGRYVCRISGPEGEDSILWAGS